MITIAGCAACGGCRRRWMPSDTLPIDEDLTRSPIALACERDGADFARFGRPARRVDGNGRRYGIHRQRCNLRRHPGQQYSMIEAENEMKVAAIEPTQGVFNFAPGDILVSFAQTNAMELRGHNLCWYAYNPDWSARS